MPERTVYRFGLGFDYAVDSWDQRIGQSPRLILIGVSVTASRTEQRDTIVSGSLPIQIKKQSPNVCYVPTQEVYTNNPLVTVIPKTSKISGDFGLKDLIELARKAVEIARVEGDPDFANRFYINRMIVAELDKDQKDITETDMEKHAVKVRVAHFGKKEKIEKQFRPLLQRHGIIGGQRKMPCDLFAIEDGFLKPPPRTPKGQFTKNYEVQRTFEWNEIATWTPEDAGYYLPEMTGPYGIIKTRTELCDVETIERLKRKSITID